MTSQVQTIATDNVLLFDDAYVDDNEGFIFTLNPPVKHPEPVLVPDQPWEIGGLCGDSMSSIIQEDGVIKMWYAVEYLEARNNAPTDAWEKLEKSGKMDNKTLADLRAAERRYALCYATSTDGVHWEKPDLGLIEFRGDKHNNIVFVGRLACTVFKDPNGPDERRYKMICGAGPRLPHVHLVEDVPPQNIYHAIYGATSPDGVHWTLSSKPIMPWYTDTTNVAYWDDQKHKYVAFVRSNEGMIYQEGKTVTPDEGFRLRYRAIGRSESEDFFNFPVPERIVEPTEEQRRDYDTGLDYYNSAALKYPFAPNSYFLFSSDFNHEPDTLDVRLYTSRDGVNHTRWENPYVRLGMEGAFDSKSLYMHTGIALTNGELLQFHTGYSYSHGKTNQREPHSGGVGLARSRKDGFISLDADVTGGELVTVPLQASGDRLTVNMDANSGGALKIAVLDAEGHPLPGFDEKDADALWNNDLAKIASWQERAELGDVLDQPVRLKFIGRGVKLFSFRFD